MNCMLFIDYENIAISLSQTRQLAVSPLQLARVFREAAECHGRVTVARAYADWDRFSGAARAFAQQHIEPRFVLQGKNSADMELSLQVQELIAESEDAVETVILATGDRDFLAIIRRLQQQNRRVVIWGVEERTSEQLKQAADAFVSMEDLLSFVQTGYSGGNGSNGASTVPSTNGHAPKGLEATPSEESSSTIGKVIPAFPTPPGGLTAFTTEVIEENEVAGTGQGTSPFSENSTWTVPALAVLVLRFDLLLYERGWQWMAFKSLSEELSDDSTFGSTTAERAWWVNQAVAEKILLTEKRPHARNPEAEITVCILNREHPLVKSGLTLVPRAIEELQEQLHNKPWVAYGLLDRILAADINLPFEAQDRRFWINTLIHMGVITTEKRDNPNYPDRPVTGCRLNMSHSLVRRFRSGPQNPEEWLDYHLILLADHFLVTREMPWMSMGQLRRALEERYGSEKMRRAVDRAVNGGVLIVEHYPNRMNPERPTAGCRLNPEHMLVQKIRRNVDGLIRLVASQLQYRPWVPMSALEKAMGFHRQYGEYDEEREAWLALLMEPGILLVDKRPDPADPEYPTIACRLNFADKRVQQALSEESIAASQTVQEPMAEAV
ncbi:MAG: NYN domain-containing protein [Armatimonadetes bacterium]|nr:NYN domain-containing protein [Armatimonadota bacterium]